MGGRKVKMSKRSRFRDNFDDEVTVKSLYEKLEKTHEKNLEYFIIMWGFTAVESFIKLKGYKGYNIILKYLSHSIQNN